MFKKVISTVLSIILLSTVSFSKPTFDKHKQKVHAAYHMIVISVGNQAATCTGYAIAPHAVLTAEHCDVNEGNEKLYLDPNRSKKLDEFPNIAVDIKGYEFDGADHMILLIDYTFKDYVEFNPAEYKAPFQGEEVYSWGSPAAMSDQYRHGYAMSVLSPEESKGKVEGERHSPNLPEKQIYLFDYAVTGGDSGSSIFDEKSNKIVGIVTYGIGRYMGAYAIEFSPEQIDVAKNYDGKSFVYFAVEGYVKN